MLRLSRYYAQQQTSYNTKFLYHNRYVLIQR